MIQARVDRLAGLDVFRGLAVAGMIIVNNPGSSDHVWWPLDHAAWNGWTPTDMVFPAFLCAVGVALGLSFPKRLDRAERAAAWARVARRVIALIALGLAFTLYAHHGLATIRFPGVLQRIGLCYGLAAALAMLSARRGADGLSHLNLPVVVGATVLLLFGYWAMMMLVPVPGFGAGQLTPAGNLAGYVDRAVFSPVHMWHLGTDLHGAVVYDPEGLFSSLPALANVLLGMLASVAWRRSPGRATGWIALGGLALLAAGLLLDPVFPINKRLWTSSFALATSGVSALLLAACMVATQRPALARMLAPFHLLGMNAILAYILSLLIGLTALKPIVPAGAGHAVTPMQWVFVRVGHVVPAPDVASFLCAFAVLAIVFAALIPLHRRGVHLRL